MIWRIQEKGIKKKYGTLLDNLKNSPIIKHTEILDKIEHPFKGITKFPRKKNVSLLSFKLHTQPKEETRNQCDE